MQKLLLNKFGLKIFSLVLATLIWFVIQSNLPTESKMTVNPFRTPVPVKFTRPVEVMVSAAHHQTFKIEPAEAEVEVVGEADVLKKLTPDDIQPFVRLTDVAHAQGSFPVYVSLPRDVRLEQVRPTRVSVTPVGPN